MLELGLHEQFTRIMEMLPPKQSADWQGMCFTARIPKEIDQVISRMLAPGYSAISTIDDGETHTPARIPQYHVIVPSIGYTFAALLTLVQREIGANSRSEKIIVYGCAAYVVALFADIFRARRGGQEIYEFHPRISQLARNKVVKMFKETSSGLMFAAGPMGRELNFPDVTCVVQVGLPVSEEQYLSGVGKTAVAKKNKRAVILLTEAEKYFLDASRQVPIEPHEDTVGIVEDSSPQMSARQDVGFIMNEIDYTRKKRAYHAYLGYMSNLLNELRVGASGLVSMANELAIQGMGCVKAPEIEGKLASGMGMEGADGLNIVDTPQSYPSKVRKVAALATRKDSHDRAAYSPVTSGS